MKKEKHPWRNDWRIKLLKMIFLPFMLIFNAAPTIHIMFPSDGKNQIIFSLLALVYFFSVLGGYFYLLRYLDEKLEKNWNEQQKKLNHLPD